MARPNPARAITVLTKEDRENLKSIAESLHVIAECFAGTKSFVSKWLPVAAVSFAIFYPTIAKVISETAQRYGVIQ